MSERQEVGRPQRYCTNCGADIRPGNAFCVACGPALTPGAEQTGPPDPGPEPSGGSVYPAGGFEGGPRGTTGHVGGVSSSLRAEDLRRLPMRLRRWLERLPLAGKAALAALVLLALFTVLSPLAAVAAILAFCVSLVALIVRIDHGKSVARWGIAAVASLALAVMLAGVAGVFYGVGPTAGTNSDGQESVDSAGEGFAYSTPPGSAESGAKSEGALDASDLNTSNFEVQQVNEVPSVNNGTGLYIIGFADSLYEEDIVTIADHVASLTQQYDFVDMEVARVASEEGGVALRVGECEFSGIRIANNYNGALATGVREGSYDYMCSEGGY